MIPMISLPLMIGTALIVSTDSIPFDILVMCTDIISLTWDNTDIEYQLQPTPVEFH